MNSYSKSDAECTDVAELIFNIQKGLSPLLKF